MVFITLHGLWIIVHFERQGMEPLLQFWVSLPFLGKLLLVLLAWLILSALVSPFIGKALKDRLSDE
jgi:hypothetical protein